MITTPLQITSMNVQVSHGGWLCFVLLMFLFNFVFLSVMYNIVLQCLYFVLNFFRFVFWFGKKKMQRERYKWHHWCYTEMITLTKSPIVFYVLSFIFNLRCSWVVVIMGLKWSIPRRYLHVSDIKAFFAVVCF